MEAFIKTPIGVLKIESDESDSALKSVKQAKKFPSKSSKIKNSNNKILNQACKQLDEYFKGKRKKFSVKLDPEGTLFQKKVWTELQKIPYGRHTSYLNVATRVKKPKSYRATGTTCSKNPLLIFVPCHRVLKSDNTLGGFALGVKTKKWLLNHENSIY